ncbi:MAG: glycosyltransferase family 4 protein [Rhodospirillales bacterium]
MPDTMVRTLKVAVVGEEIAKFRGALIAEVMAAGHVVVGCGPDREELRNDVLDLGAEYRTITVHRTGLNPLQGMSEVLATARLLRRVAPDVVFCFGTKHNLIGALAARLAGVPKVFVMIAGLGYAFSPGEEMKRRVVRRVMSALFRRAFPRCAGIFVQNEDDLRLVRELAWVTPGQPVIRTAGSGIDIEAFAYVPPVVGPPRALLIARLLKEKGVVDFVAAARIIKRQYPSCTFKLLGPFDSNPSAIGREEVAEWQREGIIEYLGETRDVRPFLRDCNLFVLPSYYREGIPRTILEALATGRPIVTSDAPGCRETVVEGVNGFLVPPRDPQVLAGAIGRFIADPALIGSMGEASRRIAVDRFDVRQVNATIMAAMGLGRPVPVRQAPRLADLALE